jgi:type I restriction enzyme M protein
MAADPIASAWVNELLDFPEQYTDQGVFWVPFEARWGYLRERARQPKIGELTDRAMDLIELSNPSLRGVLPKVYTRLGLDPQRFGELVDLINGIGPGAVEGGQPGMYGRAYEYLLERFAAAEGKRGGDFYTPSSVVRLLVVMIEPYSGRVYDPCCGSGSMFVQAKRFIKAHGGHGDEIEIYGQEVNATTWQLAKMNLAICGVEANLGPHGGDIFREDLHPALKADYILANPPFNISHWGGEQLRGDPRWRYGVSAWGQCELRLAPARGQPSIVAWHGRRGTR